MTNGAASLWLSSTTFSFLTLAGFWLFDTRWFAFVLTGSAIVHVLVVARFHPRITSSLIVSQTMIVSVSVVVVLSYVFRLVGIPKNLTAAARWYFAEFWIRGTAAAEFAKYMSIVAFGFAVFLLFAWRVWPRRAGSGFVCSCAYAASAVNVACDYAFLRPLHRVSGDPDATGFFFAIGILELHFPLMLFVLVLGLCALFCRRRPVLPASRAADRETSP